MVYLNNELQVKVISRIGSPRRNQIQDNLKSKNISFDFFDAADKTNIPRKMITKFNKMVLLLLLLFVSTKTSLI